MVEKTKWMSLDKFQELDKELAKLVKDNAPVVKTTKPECIEGERINRNVIRRRR